MNTEPSNRTMKNKAWLKIGAMAALAAVAVSCASLGRNHSHHANSLFAYLYPNQAGHVDQPGIPVLSLPLRVGVAFVPADQPNGRGYSFPADDAFFSENQKMRLMKEVSAEFKSCPFVGSIELIPTAYLTPRGGFANLDQLRSMYGVDVMVLLSYDQVQFTDEGLLSLSYWTVVGLYVVHGEKNDTQTMMDAAVYDIASRKLLFRAPGIGNIKGASTPVNLSEQLRRDSARGFDEAATNLTANLKVALNDFRERVKQAPTEYQVVHKPGYTGAGAFGGLEVALVGGIGACLLWTRRHRQS
jgi:rhombotail lipoprotein